MIQTEMRKCIFLIFLTILTHCLISACSKKPSGDPFISPYQYDEAEKFLVEYFKNPWTNDIPTVETARINGWTKENFADEIFNKLNEVRRIEEYDVYFSPFVTPEMIDKVMEIERFERKKQNTEISDAEFFEADQKLQILQVELKKIEREQDNQRINLLLAWNQKMLEAKQMKWNYRYLARCMVDMLEHQESEKKKSNLQNVLPKCVFVIVTVAFLSRKCRR